MWQALYRNIAWRAIPIAAVAAGTVFLVVNILLGPPLLGVEGGLFIRYFASLALGSEVLTGDNALTIPVGLLIHYGLSLLFTLLIVIIVHRWGLLMGLIEGGILGLAIYGFNLYTLTLVFDWFFAINSPVLALSHVLFGMTAGAVYELFDHYDMPYNTEARHEKA